MLTNYEENTLAKSVLLHGPKILENCVVDTANFQNYLDRIFNEKLDYPCLKNSIDTSDWFIPEEYKNLDIENFLVDQCPHENLARLKKELELFSKFGMIPVLRAMKYLVDTLRKNNIVWGVGRGSSVASYTLFLIGVHKIDSVKYNLPIEEFFKEI